MFFRAQNLGPLHDAEIDLSKDLIVLAGPNNSGKTYMAWSIYGLHRFRPAPRPSLDRWVRQLMESPEHAIDLAELFAQAGPELLEGTATAYRSQLHLCFAAGRAAFAATSLSLRGGNLLSNKVPTALASSIKPLVLSALWQQAPGSTRLTWNLRDSRSSSGAHGSIEWHAVTAALLSTLGEDERQSLERMLELGLHKIVRSRLFPRCRLFPAERIAVNIFAKELALKRTALVDEMVDADLDDQGGASAALVRRKAGRYPWPIRDSLEVANDLANLSKEESSFAPLADELESAVLGGTVKVSDTGEMLFSPRSSAEHAVHHDAADAADRGLEMHLTSSVVKSLSSLVFYFRYLAQPGDFIIVDEPELNLHPDNQRKITRLLAKAVRLGFKVMMSTHSDYIVRELDHLIMLSKLSPEDAKELDYDPAWALRPEAVGVYLFDQEHAQPVEVGETGFSVETIDVEINRMQETSQRFYAKLSR
jgi:hypothetical protein